MTRRNAIDKPGAWIQPTVVGNISHVSKLRRNVGGGKFIDSKQIQRQFLRWCWAPLSGSVWSKSRGKK